MRVIVLLLAVVYCCALDSSRHNEGNETGTQHNHDGVSQESQLVHVLQTRYKHSSRLARPVLDSSHIIKVLFGLSLQKILDFDEKNQVLTTLLWKEYSWFDELLTWDPAEFGGITTLSFPPTEVWIPDIRLYNNFQDSRQSDFDVEHISVSHEGRMLWMLPTVVQSSCDVDPTNFPFDEQECSMKFGFWSYSSSRVDLDFIRGANKFDLSEYKPNVEWAIRNNSAVRNDITYECCGNDTFTDLTFTLKLERLPGFYTKVMLLPTLLLSLTVLALFWIPPQRPDRTSLGMSLFTNFLLLLLLVVESIPPSSHSKLATFCCCNIAGASCAVVFSIIMVNIAGLSKTPMPSCLKLIVHSSLVTCLCVCSGNVSRERAPVRIPPSTEISNDPKCMPPPPLHEVVPLTDSSQTDTSPFIKDWIMLTTELDRMFCIVPDSTPHFSAIQNTPFEDVNLEI